MRVYLDNVIASGVVLGDLQPPAELLAARAILKCPKVKVFTSRHSRREQERTRDPGSRKRLLEAQGDLPTVEKDHEVLGFGASQDHVGGIITIPVVTDIVDQELYDKLVTRGARKDDPHHLMYAVHNECQRFVTLDTKDVLPIRTALEPACRGMKIVTPTELAVELGLPVDEAS